MKKTRIVNALAAVGLVSILGLLVYKTRSVDLDSHNEIISTLRQLKQVDAEWNVDVLRSKTGFNSNYDPVASPLPLIAQLQSQLQEKSSRIWGAMGASNDKIDLSLKVYRDSMEQKIALIERFKSQNSILRNSSRFLPVAGEGTLSMLKQGSLDAKRLGEFERSLNELVVGSMNYLLTTDTALKAAITEQITWLNANALTLPTELREQILTLTPHAATVMRQHEAGDKILSDLSALPTAKQLDQLMDVYNEQHSQTLGDQQVYRFALVAYSVFLLALLGFFGWRLLKSYRLLNKSNTELKKAHQELRESQMYVVQSEKMSALGQMVAGIAHEINTPLAYVKGTIDLLHEQLIQFKDLTKGSFTFTEMLRNRDADKSVVNMQFARIHHMTKKMIDNQVVEDIDSLLKNGSDGIEQISEIVLNLKNFSRLDRAKVATFDVREGLKSTLVLSRNMLKNRVRIEQQFEDVPNITCSPSQINQVFLNIITNAAQAIPEGRDGVITLRTSREGKDMVRVEIQDNGGGIPQDVLPKIFDPFFTTKEIGKGTGMGLSISFKIIEQHGGKISVDTEVGIGTVFNILLPINPPIEATQTEELALAA